jgi:hypothetical protein
MAGKVVIILCFRQVVCGCIVKLRRQGWAMLLWLSDDLLTCTVSASTEAAFHVSYDFLQYSVIVVYVYWACIN